MISAINMKSTIAIIDRYPVLRQGLTLFLERLLDDVVIVSSDDFQSFLKDHAGLRPDILIVALGQREHESNVPLIMMVKQLFDLCRVIFYDERADFAMLADYVRMGVTNYLSKGSDVAELKRVVLEVLDGKYAVSQETVASLKNTCVRTEGNIKLTDREYSVALHLSEGKKVGWIASHLRKNPSNISAAKRSILKKLEVDSIVMLRDLFR